MSPFKLQVTQLLRAKGFLVVYVLSLLLLFISLRGWLPFSTVQMELSIAVIDNDESQDSRTFIDLLEENTLVRPILTSEADAVKLLKREVIEAYLVIPKDYFKPFGRQQLSLNYLTYNAVAPVLVDVIAQDLMPFIAKSRLIRATTTYLDDSWTETALEYYTLYEEDSSFSLTTQLVLVDTWLGIKGDINQKKINYARSLIGYGLTLIILLLVLTLSGSGLTDYGLQPRTGTIFGLNRSLFISRRVVHYTLVLLPWFFILNSIAGQIGLTLNAALAILVMGVLVIVLYYELLSLFQLKFQRHIYAQLITISLVLIPALLGGAFFSIDLLSGPILELVGWLPFYHITQVFYECLTSGGLSAQHRLLIGCYVLVIGLIMSYNYKKTSTRISV
ncbi:MULTISPECIES: ABC transporter permease [unclassified Fusibacter]|uniref:ABC transporter permease n=1 Tax=unclassified Fusibacter TaxID=2624464 RepID=UPI00101098D1|nr:MULTISPECIES: ABC transporter permease [unclassified Fusibacter]MCK8059391.1 ABC transporter permease [Fusibacter sp. A2]NPE21145.1 ABC transporter permease [Fusibacter sp. A1]RXV62414.1 ABC transporter permease [Fusibacter sp. A1]